ncbi:5592_t:CDS:1, partial [Acaulospora colombiana]
CLSPSRHYSTQRIVKNPLESIQYYDYSQIGSPTDFSLNDFIILPNHFTPSEQKFLSDQSLKKLKRILGKQVIYQDGHFDGVIHGYRECQASHWGEDEDRIMEVFHQKVYSLFPENIHWLPTHILELSECGGIREHVDHVEVVHSAFSDLSSSMFD